MNRKPPAPVNTIWTNDQWMPVLAVKPDGTQLFMAWYDRRNDPNNGLMEVFGRWGTIDTNGAVNLGNEFRITPVSFPHVFSGTDTNTGVIGNYDPVYPPGGVNLHWWYPEWPVDIDTFDQLRSHVGEYNATAVTLDGVLFAWTDNRIRSSPISNRYQSDIRFIKIPWR